MFCTNCGASVNETDQFCTKCGRANSLNPESAQQISSTRHSDERWWHRLVKIIYILLYIPLPLVIYGAWIVNSQDYDYLTRSVVDTSGKAFGYMLLTLVIYLTIVRLIKVAFLYVTLGQKPDWRKEFKKFF